MTTSLVEALRLSQARVRLAHRAATPSRPGVLPERDPVLYLVAANDGDYPVGADALVVGLDDALEEACRVGGTKEVLTATITPLGRMSSIDLTHLRQHLLTHPYGGI